jgi:hypothetical protein
MFVGTRKMTIVRINDSVANDYRFVAGRRIDFGQSFNRLWKTYFFLNCFVFLRLLYIFAMLEVAGWRDRIKPGHSL